jgi:hypothetical protein
MSDRLRRMSLDSNLTTPDSPNPVAFTSGIQPKALCATKHLSPIVLEMEVKSSPEQLLLASEP